MPEYTYLLLHTENIGSRDEVKAFIDDLAEINYWYSCIPNSFFVVSEKTASELTTLFREFTKDKGRFLILDTATDRNGWLPQKAWTLMNDPSKHGQ